MNVEAEKVDTERTAARQRQFSLWALLVVLPVALWVAIGDEWVSFVKKNHDVFIDVPAGSSLAFGGSDWRLEAADVRQTVAAANTAPAPPNTLPPNTSLVLVRIAVTPRDAAAVERLNQCVLWLSSSDGRRWLSTSGLRDTSSALPESCSGNYRSHPEVGQTFRFEQAFVVPTVVANQVEPLVILGRASAEGAHAPLLRLRRS